jgi:hypothetical protein
MSVGLLIISKTNPEQREFTPVAVQAIFTSKWLPGCSALKLEWVPLFETGIPIDASNASAVLDELRQLHQWMSGRSGYEYETERITRLIDRLDSVWAQPDFEIFIG